MSERKVAFAILAILVLQISVPILPVDATSGRTTPDFSVTALTFSSGGSIDDGGENILAPSTHTVRIVVQNIGVAAGTASLQILHETTANAGNPTLLQTIDLGTVGAASTTNPILYDWTASSGDDQTLIARVVSSSDSDNSNNEMRIDFDVKIQNEGVILGHNVPGPTPGFTDLRLSHTTHTYEVTVRNDGVTDLTAVYEINFTENSNPSNQFSVWSDQVGGSGALLMEPGNLLTPASGQAVSATFDASSMLGSWTMVSRVTFNGTSWTNQLVADVSTVTFSNYIVDLSTPNDRSIEPGATTNVLYVVTNLGDADDLVIQLGSDLGWHDNSQDGSSIHVAAGGSRNLFVPVTVPTNAVKPTVENVYLNLSSANGSYTARSVGHVMVGDQYQATTTPDQPKYFVVPGTQNTSMFSLLNSGNVPSAFHVDAGLSSSAENWIIESTVTTTGVLAAGENVSIPILVTPAPISSPLNPAERNANGDVLNLWVSATPVDGGVPTLGQVELEVRPVIAVDPNPELDLIELTTQEILDANGTGGIDRIVSLSVEVRHNLGGGVSGGIDADITTTTPTFVPLGTGGVNEGIRWGTDVTPSSVTNLQIGQSLQSFLAIDGPTDELPMAGEITVSVTATPVVSTGLSSSFNGLISDGLTREIKIIVPSITDGKIITEGPLDADVGNQTNFTLRFANTGNNISSYRLSIVDDLPDLWSAVIETSDISNPSIIANLTPSMADHPLTGDAHISNVTLRVTTDPQAPADTMQPLTIRAENRQTGELISLSTIYIRVEESINFELIPTNHTVDLSPYETPLTRVYINNTGNVATTYSVWLDDSQANDVDFILESPTEVVVGPGYSEAVKIRLSPDFDASADEFHMITLWVEAIGGMNLSASVVANVTEDHALAIEVHQIISVTPGVDEVIQVTFNNTGNLEENLNVTAFIEGGWGYSWEQNQITLPIDGTLQNELTVNVPALGGNYSLANGDVHNVTISLYHATNGDFLAAKKITLIVAPVFLVEFEDWPDVAKYSRQSEVDWRVKVKNVGNKDVRVTVDYDILKPGLDINSLDWNLEDPAPNSLFLPVGSYVMLNFTVAADKFEPDIFTEALLRVTLTPNDSEVTGSAVAETALKMSRLFSYQDYKLGLPPIDDSNMTEDIIWSHIPGVSGNSAVEYMIELCDAERRINTSTLNLGEGDWSWSFALEVEGENQILDLSNDCEGSAHSVISLPLRQEYVTDNPLKVVIDTPNRPNILKNDGYDLTFRLYHPDEHNGFTEYTEATFSFYFKTEALLTISEFDYGGEDLMEGATSIISAKISNIGTSVALDVTATLTCEGVQVDDPVYSHGLMVGDYSKTIQWEVESDHLDWWAQSTDVTCELTVVGTDWDGSPIEPKSITRETSVKSWSPGVTVSFIAVLILIGASVGLLRLVGQNDKFRLAAVYSGVLGLGFAFHLMGLISNDWGGPVILFIAALWVWIMTWKSTIEFQLIHEDYQRARKGISTLYSDHFDVLSNAKRQLSIILAMPILGMVGVILGIPPQMSPDSANMFTLISYLVIVIFGVTFLIWNANRMYGSLYGRLTEVEVQASRIERDLGDPARLLTELASDGLDISSIISQPSSASAAALGDAPESAVIDWDQDVGVLMGDDLESSTDVESGSEIQGEADAELELEMSEVSEENQENVVPDFDVGDLFEDEEGGE